MCNLFAALLLLLSPGALGGLKTFLIASNNISGTITEDLIYLLPPVILLCQSCSYCVLA
jgi:hypothetical protein